MIYRNLKVLKLVLIICLLQIFTSNGFAQLTNYILTDRGDTLNGIDRKGFKQGKWVIRVNEVRGEPGYEEEGIFKNGQKEGVWKRFNPNSDLIGLENYRFGGKDGVQQYYTMLGDLVRVEGWRAYNPDAPYDTIPIYGQGNGEIISYKVVKAEQYSVKHGEWKFYEPVTGRLLKTEKFDRGFPIKDPDKSVTADANPKKKVKPREVLEYEKKHSGKKKVKEREGQTGIR